jgi:hypothetical protein
MKKIIFNLSLVLLVLLTFNSCKKEVPANGNPSKSSSELNGKWNLIRLYGGIMGTNEVHTAGEIEWTFNHQNSTVTVNNTVGNSSYYYLPSGTYNYQKISNSNQNYLVIDANELGEFVISGNQMRIDENKKSSGEGACGFYFVLERD